jgi:hypothetical protein
MSKFKLNPVVAAVCLLSGLSTPAFAKASADEQNVDKLMQKINSRTASLEKEVSQLKAQLTHLKKMKQAAPRPVAAAAPAQVNGVPVAGTAPATTVPILVGSPHLEAIRILELGATPVISSPYIGVRSEFNASDLIINIPSYNQDVQLLEQRQKLDNKFIEKCLPPPAKPLVEISGKVEGQMLTARGYTAHQTSDINLSAAEVDVTTHLNPWVIGFISIVYENIPPTSQYTAAVSQVRSSNSRFFLDKGFVTVGNLNTTPFYGTLGQRNVPFGQYPSYMISSPLTQFLGQTKARSLLLGYQHQAPSGVYASAYTFRGETRVNPTSNINQVGGTAGFDYVCGKVSSNFGADVIANITDSTTMQNTGIVSGAGFRGFGMNSSTERLEKRIPGVDVHENLNVGPFNFLAEYTGAVARFTAADLSFNGEGARPRAFHLEGAYKFAAWHRPTYAALGYDETREALALSLPRNRWIAAVGTSFWRNTIASLEFHYDKNYDSTDTAAGLATGVQPSPVTVPLGRNSNTVTFQFGAYF